MKIGLGASSGEVVKNLAVAAGLGLAVYVLLSRFQDKESQGPALRPRIQPTETEARVMAHHETIWNFAVSSNLDPGLIAAVIAVESAGNPTAVGSSGEVGLMQLLPTTAEWFCNVSSAQLVSAQINVSCGTRYLRYLIDQCRGSVAAGLAAYNGGLSNVTYDTIQDKFNVPARSKAYAGLVLDAADRYTELFRYEYRGEYDVRFVPRRWPMEADSLAGIGQIQLLRPRWGFRRNIALDQAGRIVPGACPVPARGLGLRQGTRWLYQ